MYIAIFVSPFHVRKKKPIIGRPLAIQSLAVSIVVKTTNGTLWGRPPQILLWPKLKEKVFVFFPPSMLRPAKQVKVFWQDHWWLPSWGWAGQTTSIKSFGTVRDDRRSRNATRTASRNTFFWRGLVCNITYFFAHAGQDDEECHKEGDGDDAECDGGHIARHGRPVGAVVKRRSTVVTKCIEPAFHCAAAAGITSVHFYWSSTFDWISNSARTCCCGCGPPEIKWEEVMIRQTL